MTVKVPTAEFSTSPRLLDFFAENPGEWANSYGIKIVNVDVGTKQKSKITVSGTWTLGTDVNLSLSYGEDTTTIVQPFVEDNDTSLTNLAAKIKDFLDGFGNSVVEIVEQPYSNLKYIAITAPIAGKDLVLEGWSIAGTAQLVVTQTVTVKGIPSTGRFQVNLYSSASINVPVDIYKCSFKHETDENGISMYVEDVINKSQYIRVYLNADAEDIQLDGDDESITWLSGGDDGTLPTSADVIKGWDAFANPEETTIRIAIQGGYTTADVAKKITSICESRKDCFGILETPLGLTKAEDLVEYRKVTLGIDSNRVALYAPGVYVTDTETGSKIMCPISGIIASNYSYVDKNYGDQYAPAGYNRAVITAGEPTAYYYEEDRDLLGPAQINYVGRHNLNLPWSIMDEKTLTAKTSWLSWVHVRRTITRMQINITDSLYYKLWNFISEDDLSDLQNMAQAYGDQMAVDKRAQRVAANAYSSPEEQVQGIAHLDMLVQPMGVMRSIKFTTIITNSGADFDESGL